MSDTPPIIVTLADAASEAIRAINHATVRGEPVPAPVLYAALGSLKRLGPALQQALTQLGDALTVSLSAFRVYEDDGTDPTPRAAACRAALLDAAAHAGQLGRALEAAQQAIAGQGYHPDPPGPRRSRPRLRVDCPGPGRPGPSR